MHMLYRKLPSGLFVDFEFMVMISSHCVNYELPVYAVYAVSKKLTKRIQTPR
jgi:hypothetical protein